VSYRLAIFDFDGTLADTLPAFLRAMNDAAPRYGFESLDGLDLDTLRGMAPREIAARIRLPIWKTPMIAAFVRRRMAQEIARMRIFPGVEAMLDRLRAADVTIAIVSSNAEATIRQVLGPRLAAEVAYYGCGGSVFGKRRYFRRALARTGAARPDAIAIGDEIRDLEAAHAEGIAFGGVTWGYATPEALRARRPELMFERVEEIGERLSGSA